MVLGLGGPLGPGVVAGDLIVVAIVAHVPQGFWAGGGKVGWEFPVLMAAAAFAVALLGSGSWALDGVLGLAYSDALRWLWLGIVAVGVVLALLLTVLLAPRKATT